MFKKFVVLSVTALLLCSVAPAHAAKTCYTKAEAEAEQAIRIHSELMVIGLNCQHKYKAGGGQNLYAAYRDFTLEHAKTFAAYETQLLEYFKKSGAPDPEASLNTLRTVFANKISTDAAKMRPDLFCYEYAPRIQKVSGMQEGTLRKWAGTFYPSHPVSMPLCD